jgi:hypothetical protein
MEKVLEDKELYYSYDYAGVITVIGYKVIE